MWSPFDKGESCNLPVGRWLKTGWILLFQQYWLSRFCSFREAEENPHQVTSHLAKPASKTTNGNPTECSDQDTFPMACDNSWKIKVVYRKKVNVSKLSLKHSFHTPNNFPWKQMCSVSSSTHKVLPVAPFRLGQVCRYSMFQRSWIQTKSQLRAHLSPRASTENLTLKLPKISIGIIFMTFSSD